MTWVQPASRDELCVGGNANPDDISAQWRGQILRCLVTFIPKITPLVLRVLDNNPFLLIFCLGSILRSQRDFGVRSMRQEVSESQRKKRKRDKARI
jgi:hypothetical protein